MPRFLFLLKKRDAAWGVYSDGEYKLPSGLRNSVAYTVAMLHKLGFEARAVEVDDANCIDREVTAYKPDYAICEALWVPPGKFTELKALWRHRHVHWMVRNHSELPFLSMETWAMTWLASYISEGVEVTCNSPRAMADLQGLGFPPSQLSFTPNWYPIGSVRLSDSQPHAPRCDNTVHIGSLGAVRPLKNPLLQLAASIRFAALIGKRLRYFVNTSRVEMGANPILRNLRAMADAVPNCELAEMPWLDTPDLWALLRSIDIHLQCSFSETFNIVSCDATAQNVPVIVSPEIPWLGAYAQVDPTDGSSIVNGLLTVYRDRHPARRIQRQRQDLLEYCERSEMIWWKRFR